MANSSPLAFHLNLVDNDPLSDRDEMPEPRLDRASELVDISADWIQKNRLITMMSVAVLAAVIGFFMGSHGLTPGGNRGSTDNPSNNDGFEI